MIGKLFAFIPFMFTDNKHESGTNSSILSMLAFIVFCGFQWYALVELNQTFDSQAYGISVGAILFGKGVADGGRSFLSRVNNGRGKVIPDNPD